MTVLGATPPFEERCRQTLIEEAIKPEAIQLIDGISNNDWETSRMIDAWLLQHPDQRVSILCDRFSSKRWSLIVNRTITKSVQNRVTVEGVVDPRYNDSNWWRSRIGIKAYFGNLLHLGYAQFHGEDHLPVIDWSQKNMSWRCCAHDEPQPKMLFDGVAGRWWHHLHLG